jgi:hypothetical protein
MHFTNGHEHPSLPVSLTDSRYAAIIPQKQKRYSLFLSSENGTIELRRAITEQWMGKWSSASGVRLRKNGKYAV